MPFTHVQTATFLAPVPIDPPTVTVSPLAAGSLVVVIVASEASVVPVLTPPVAAGVAFELGAQRADATRILQLWHGRVLEAGAETVAVTTDGQDGWCLVAVLEYTPPDAARLADVEDDFDTATAGSYVYLNALDLPSEVSLVVTAVLWSPLGGSPDVEPAPGFTERVDHTDVPHLHVQDQFDGTEAVTEWSASDIDTFLSVGASFVPQPIEELIAATQTSVIVPPGTIPTPPEAAGF